MVPEQVRGIFIWIAKVDVENEFWLWFGLEQEERSVTWKTDHQKLNAWVANMAAIHIVAEFFNTALYIDWILNWN